MARNGSWVKNRDKYRERRTHNAKKGGEEGRGGRGLLTWIYYENGGGESEAVLDDGALFCR